LPKRKFGSKGKNFTRVEVPIGDGRWLQKNPKEVETSQGGGKPGQPSETLKKEMPRELPPWSLGETGGRCVGLQSGRKTSRSAET